VVLVKLVYGVGLRTARFAAAAYCSRISVQRLCAVGLRKFRDN